MRVRGVTIIPSVSGRARSTERKIALVVPRVLLACGAKRYSRTAGCGGFARDISSPVRIVENFAPRLPRTVILTAQSDLPRAVVLIDLSYPR